ncbi:hypothetical protein [Priestia endophytica]|uniref:hypothetical protein n=1 Tax=Priestia endophytica TaxID=135735 RepID=UPI00115C3FCD|nr:hypothetical protein [Priestia endophytica]
MILALSVASPSYNHAYAEELSDSVEVIGNATSKFTDENLEVAVFSEEMDKVETMVNAIEELDKKIGPFEP